MNGIINLLLMKLHLIDSPVLWMGKGEYFWGILGATEVWKDVGWNTIIYLAAITAIDPAQYEAAEIDGASRFKRMLYITLPGLKPVIVILLIMNMGSILESGFEPQYLLGNGMNMDYSENLDIFVLKYGLGMGNFSLGTAAGIFKTVEAYTMRKGNTSRLRNSSTGDRAFDTINMIFMVFRKAFWSQPV
ncbi:hypothetical protein HK101_001180 [Irineochytrium annulatum]|nr:hypothetical protein HK101_001180 [Irineochytrium annulatum]